MKRVFERDEQVTLESEAHYPFAAVVTLVSDNQSAVAFTVDEYIALRDSSGGMAITKSIPCFQDEDGKLTDLFGNEWRIV